MLKFDLVVIGSGPGGYVAAIRAAQLGLKVACVEKEKTLGGTCLNVGCIPSKALLQSSEHYEWLQQGSDLHGISCENVSLDFPKMMARKTQVVSGLVSGVDHLFKQNGVTSISGTARFVAEDRIQVNSEEIQAKNFILATGSEPIALPFLPFDEKIIVSSTGALSLPQIPQRLVVVGAGVIGVEIASVYRRLGSQVTIVEMLDHICPTVDSALSKGLLQVLKKQELTFKLSTKVASAQRAEGKITLSLEPEGQIEADVVLVAIGRRPYTSGLDLEKIGVQTQKGFVLVDNNFRTNKSHIYAIGDLIDGPMLAHRASEEGYAVAELLAGHPATVNYMTIPQVIYTHPEVASVGMTESEARATGFDVKVGTSYFRGNPRARCSGFTEGFVKVIGSGPEMRLVGLHILGSQASELINSGVVAIDKRATLRDLALAPCAHPTLSEAIKEACGQALSIAVHT